MLAIPDSAGNSAGKSVPANNKNNQTNLDFDKQPRIKVLHGNWGVARWRIFRAWTIEATSISHEQNRLANANGSVDPSTQTMPAARSLSWHQNLDNLSCCKGRFDRQYHRVADRLLRLQEKMRQRSRESADNSELNK